MASDARPKSIKQAAVEVFKHSGEPLKSTEIAHRVMKVKGVRLAGQHRRARRVRPRANGASGGDPLGLRTARLGARRVREEVQSGAPADNRPVLGEVLAAPERHRVRINRGRKVRREHGHEILAGVDDGKLTVQARHVRIAVRAVEPPEVTVVVLRICDVIGGRYLDPGG